MCPQVLDKRKVKSSSEPSRRRIKRREKKRQRVKKYNKGKGEHHKAEHQPRSSHKSKESISYAELTHPQKKVIPDHQVSPSIFESWGSLTPAHARTIGGALAEGNREEKQTPRKKRSTAGSKQWTVFPTCGEKHDRYLEMRNKASYLIDAYPV